MNRHPGAGEHTLRMLCLSGLAPGAAILDLGAGDGDAVELLRAMGYDAMGLDLRPSPPLVLEGDLLNTGLQGAQFDGIISQCAFFLSGNVPGALRESRRLLKPGGVLMLSDVFFEEPGPLLTAAGLNLLYSEDLTDLWRDYYLRALWEGTAEACDIPGGKSSYRLLIAGERAGDLPGSPCHFSISRKRDEPGPDFPGLGSSYEE